MEDTKKEMKKELSGLISDCQKHYSLSDIEVIETVKEMYGDNKTPDEMFNEMLSKPNRNIKKNDED